MRIKLDLHVHTKYSYDGILSPEKVLKLAINKGLNGIAITDHNSIRGAKEAKEANKNKDFIVIVGSEIKTNRGEVMGLFLQEEIASRDFYEAIEEIKAQDGIITIPHPFDTMRSSTLIPSKEDAKLVHGVEVFNSRCIFSKYNKLAMEFSKSNGLSMTAGSDAHFANEVGLSGIIVHAEDEEEIKKAILNKKVEIFGKKSSILNHGMTKMIELWRRLRSSGLP